ncbi:hypothetical protein BST83_15730 [Polaribacter filamentus]|uniref:TonB-dependent receptor plug domain-containing protein n=1 Tax=Polaribacter filamentus TaxID=53483 RepID=A0A2S7L110_9FLAO|nr:TonB-dependent receptor [Polaribacter filamentus]PQB08413.1 hypothetical protein BST83_15730 [Polaribacter filamentus]
MKYILTLLLLFSISTFSQSITGVVMDGEFNESLPFASILVKGTTNGANTDIDGKFQIKVQPGTYTLVFSFVGYATIEMSDVLVKSNKETFIQVTLKAESNQLDAVIIKTTSKKNSEASVLNLQKRSINLVDGLSIQAIKKAGDSDVASAIKRVPGISVQGGKFVYVRGLGDRYSKTTLNGMELPGLDPDRNTIPMDIFPTNLIENIIVKKSASSEIGADFTGGTVDINLKDFSFNPEYNLNVSTGYNPDMHFNSNFLADVKSSTDWRGKDDGSRNLLIDPTLDLPPALPLPLVPADEAAILTENTKKLNKNMAPIQERSDLNYSFGFSASNGYKFKKDGESSIGYLAAISYKSETTFYDDFYRATVFRTPTDGTQNDLIQNSILGTKNTYLSTLLGVTFKDSKNKIAINFIDLQNGESNASNLKRQTFIENPYWGEGSVITYTQRNLRSIPIYGKHNIGDNLFTVNWKFAKSSSTLNDKDFRRTIFETDEDVTFYQISPNAIASPSRLWRDLDEKSTVAKVDLEIPFETNIFSGKISAGASYIGKERDFSSKRFDIFYNGNSQVLGGDPNAILADENIWVQSPNLFQTTTGSYIKGGFERTNVYNSESKNDAFYFSSELKFSEMIKAVIGVRFETYQLRYTGENLLGTKFENELFLDDKDLFSNLNLIISPNEKSNIRASYYKTTARPTFREASSAYLIDPVTETFFLGNPDIKSSYIDNIDLRYEIFGNKSEMFAFSLFSKNFKDPIEISVVSDDTPNDFTAINNEKATVRGIEFELRKNLFVINNLTFNVNTNASFISAKQTMSDIEYDSRVILADPGQVISRERELQGQSPYMINAGLVVNESEKELEVGVFYNVQGPTLEFVGFGGIPDIYSEPFHNLDFSASKVFNGESISKKITLKANNILQDKRESNYVWNDEKSGLFRSFSPGILFSLGVSITFN